MQKRLLVISLLIISATSTLLAQENLPYSSRGLGQLQSNLFTNQIGMGGLSAAQTSFNTVNYQNPAALGKLLTTTFEVDAYANVSNARSKDSNYTSGTSTLANLVLAFPVMRNHWGAAIGLQPVSVVSYNVYQNYVYNGYPYSAIQQQQGTGGTYRLFMAHGFRLKLDSNNYLHIGARAEYMFGSIQTTNQLIFPDSINAFASRQEVYNNISGIVLGGGLQYETHIKKHTITIGANITLPTNVVVKQYEQWNRYNTVGTRDTVYQDHTNGYLKLPLQGSAGIMWAYNNRWQAGVQYDFGEWQNYRFLGASDSLGRSWRVSAGAEYRPKDDFDAGYWSKVKYRFGFYTGVEPLVIDNTPQHIYAMTLGFGFPLASVQQTRAISELNVALEFGTQGTTNNGQLRENFFRLHLGFSLNDIWFQHRKFN